MSFRSWVYESNAFSIAEVSVFWSTTRKFRWASGGSVTCYRFFVRTEYVSSRLLLAYTNAC